MDDRACAGVAGNGVHSSSAMVIVASSKMLDFDRARRRQAMRRAVQVRLERDAVRVELSQFGQRHDLEAAGVGQDRAGPVHEAMQPAEARNAFGAGPQHQVVGVAEYDVGAGGAH